MRRALWSNFPQASSGAFRPPPTNSKGGTCTTSGTSGRRVGAYARAISVVPPATGGSHAEEDLDRAQQLGLNALRLSLEWSRLEPKPGRWDKHAIRRYREILKAIRARGMRVFIALHHFTHPTWFEYKGAIHLARRPAAFRPFQRTRGHRVR